MRRPTRTTLAVAITAAVSSLLASSPAQADRTNGCTPGALSQPFAPWGDPSYYGLLPNGGFERGASAWSLDGQAQVVSGNESFHVQDDSDSNALNLGESGGATSDPVCATLQDPTLRLFARNTGSPLSALVVSAQFVDGSGQQRTLPLAVINSSAPWQPTAPILIDVNLLNLPAVSDGTTNVSFSFTPVGPDGNWTIDDVYLDPFKTK